MKKQKFWILISLIVMLGLLLSACGGDEEPADTPEPADVSQEEVADEPAEEVVDEPAESEPGEESSTVIIIPEDPAAFSSYFADTG